MLRKKVQCFTTKGLPQGSVPEFDRQLVGQEAGINNMTANEYINGREAFESGNSVRSRNVARNAKTDHQITLKKKLLDGYQAEGFSPHVAKQKAAMEAAEKMKTLAALHNPDMVVAGKDVNSDFGDRNINSRIGAHWNKGQRMAELDRAASDVPETMRGRMKMNAQRERCKRGWNNGRKFRMFPGRF